MERLSLELMIGFGIGLSLGLLGGGGSILTVPALVYVIGQSPQTAVMTSLAIVGANSAAGAFLHHLKGLCNWKVALVFGSAGMVTAYLAARLAKLLSPEALLIAFASLMLVIGLMMIAQRRQPVPEEACVPRDWPVSLASGAGVGLLTGVLGVGGGFLIVPALVIVVGLPISQAVGTSLIIISANSLAGLLGHLGAPGFDLTLTIVIVGAGIAGMIVGTRIAGFLSAVRLKQIFALFVICLGIYLLVDNLPKLFIQ